MASHNFAPGMGFKATSTYTNSNQADALHFEEGQLIEGLHISEDGNWIYGEIGNSRGWFPTEKASRMDLSYTPSLPPRNRRPPTVESAIYLEPSVLNLPKPLDGPGRLVRTGSTLSSLSNYSDLTVDESIPLPKTATDYANAVDGALKQLQQQGSFKSTESSYVKLSADQSRRAPQGYTRDESPYMVMESDCRQQDVRCSPATKTTTRPYNKLINFVTFARVDRGHQPSTLRDVSEFSYCDNFWSDRDANKTGFDVILEKQQLGRQLFQEMSKVIKERAAVEDTYAKSLLRISKSNLGMDEPGTLGAVWRDIIRSVEDEAEVHRLWAISLVEKGRKELIAYVQKVREGTRKATERIVKKRKLLQGKYNAIERSMKKVSDKEEKLRSSRTNAGKHRARTELDQVEDELKSTIKSYNEAQRNWMSEMVTSSLELERFEEQRVELMKTSFGIYVHDRIQVAEQLDRSTEWLEQRIETIDPRLDRKEFVHAHGTGALRPTDFTLDI